MNIFYVLCYLVARSDIFALSGNAHGWEELISFFACLETSCDELEHNASGESQC